MKSILFTFLSAVLLTHSVYGQDELAEYNQARQLVNQGKYDQAMHLLNPYLDYETYGEVAKYARYHFSKAAYGRGQYKLAENTLQQIIQKQPWKHQDDVKYLLALSYFQLQNISEALNLIAQIEDEVVLEQAYRASFRFLQDVSTSVLIVNLPEHMDNQGLVMALKNKLAKRTVLSAGEQKIYDQIKNLDFSGDSEGNIKRELNKTLEIAVVLPFNYSGGTGVRRLDDNNFVFDFYKGIKIAADEAKKEGMLLEVKTFDTERKPEVLEKILDDPFFEVADVILGPIYPEESDIVANFAEKRKIPFINPLSNILAERSAMDYSFLFRPSVQSLSKGIIDYIKKLPGKRIAVAYSGNTRDEMLANQFAESAKREGFQVVVNRKVSQRDMRSFFDNLGMENPGTRVDQIVIFSDDPNVASPTFAVMESLSTDVPIIVMDSWLYFNFASYEMLDVQNFHFVGNNTINFSKEEVTAFREEFYSRFTVYPDLNAHLGYEIIQWISGAINQKQGFDLQNNLDKVGFQEGILTFGFDFRDSKSNNFVPILNLEDGILTVE